MKPPIGKLLLYVIYLAFTFDAAYHHAYAWTMLMAAGAVSVALQMHPKYLELENLAKSKRDTNA